MVSDLDVFRSANLLVIQHGAEATIHAAMQPDAMIDKGDTWTAGPEGRGQRVRLSNVAWG